MNVKLDTSRGPILIKGEQSVDAPQLPSWTGGLRRMSAASSWENALEDAAVTPSVLIVDGLELNRRLLRGILKRSSILSKRPKPSCSRWPRP